MQYGSKPEAPVGIRCNWLWECKSSCGLFQLKAMRRMVGNFPGSMQPCADEAQPIKLQRLGASDCEYCTRSTQSAVGNQLATELLQEERVMQNSGDCCRFCWITPNVSIKSVQDVMQLNRRDRAAARGVLSWIQCCILLSRSSSWLERA